MIRDEDIVAAHTEHVRAPQGYSRDARVHSMFPQRLHLNFDHNKNKKPKSGYGNEGL